MLGKKPWWFWAQIALTLLFLYPIWSLPYLPLNDLPNHMASIHLLAKYDSGAQTYIVPNSAPFIPNSSVFVFMRAIAPFTGVDFAARALLSIYVIMLPISLAYFLRSINKAAEPLSLAAFAFMYNWIFMMGFLNNALALPIFLFAAGYWLSLKDSQHTTTAQAIVFALLSLLLFFTHISGFLALAVLVIFFRLADYKRQNFTFDAAGLLPCALLSLYFVSQSIGGGNGSAIFAPPIRALSYVITMLPNPAFAIIFAIVAILYLFISSKQGNFSLKTSAVGKHFLMLALLLIAAYFFVPENLPRWQFASARAIPLIFLCAFSFFSDTLASSSKSISNEITFAFMFFSLFSFAFSFVSLQLDSALLVQNARISSFLAPNSAVLTLGLGFASSQYNPTSPLYHAWGYWVIDKDVFTPFLFAEDYSPVKYAVQNMRGISEINADLDSHVNEIFSENGSPDEICGLWGKYYSTINWTLISENYEYVVFRAGKCQNITIPCSYFQLGEVNGTIVYRRVFTG